MRLARGLLVAFVALLPAGAPAQQTCTCPDGTACPDTTTASCPTTAALTPTLSVATGNSSAFNQAACSSATGGTAVNYAFPNGFVSGSTFTVFAVDASTAGTCPATPPDANRIFLASTTLTTDNQSGLVTLPAATLTGGSCPGNTVVNYLVCAVATAPLLAGQTQTTYSASVTVTYDSQPPAAPSLAAPRSGDQILYLTWAAQIGADHFVIYYRANGPAPTGPADPCAGTSTASSALTDDAGVIVVDAGAATPDAGPPSPPPFDPTGWCAAFPNDPTRCGSVTISDGAATQGAVRSLVDDQSYELVLVAVDAAANSSAGSAPQSGTPLAVADFYRRFEYSGGKEKGGFGCSVAGPALPPLAALAVLALVRRRRAAA